MVIKEIKISELLCELFWLLEKNNGGTRNETCYFNDCRSIPYQYIL